MIESGLVDYLLIPADSGQYIWIFGIRCPRWSARLTILADPLGTIDLESYHFEGLPEEEIKPRFAFDRWNANCRSLIMFQDRELPRLENGSQGDRRRTSLPQYATIKAKLGVSGLYMLAYFHNVSDIAEVSPIDSALKRFFGDSQKLAELQDCYVGCSDGQRRLFTRKGSFRWAPVEPSPD